METEASIKVHDNMLLIYNCSYSALFAPDGCYQLRSDFSRQWSRVGRSKAHSKPKRGREELTHCPNRNLVSGQIKFPWVFSVSSRAVVLSSSLAGVVIAGKEEEN